MNRLRKIAISIVLLLISSLPAKAEGIFSQIVLPFETKKTYTYKYNQNDHALVLDFKNTAPSELTPLEQYDERLIRRLLVKDMGPVGTEVQIVLRDRDVRAYVTDFNEPFRITIDLFDATYEEDRDSSTGMPVNRVQSENETSSHNQQPNASLSLMVSNDGSTLSNPTSANDYRPTYASNNSPQNQVGARKLLQPTPTEFKDAGQLAEVMKNTADGIGKNWRTYPTYIYRAQTVFFEGDSRKRWTKEDRANAAQSAKAMADYAGKLYNFGHENKALIAYQQVLHKDATVFNRDALHLFKFAEIHLGQGNMTLARGYYNQIIEKNAASPLAKFAKLRVQDIRAISLIEQNKYTELHTLLPALESISTSTNGDLNMMIAIRKAHWSKEGLANKYSPEYLPQISEETYNELSNAYTTVQSRKAKFEAANLILNHALSNTTRWSRATADFAANYFKEFDEAAANPWRQNLKEKLYNTLNTVLQQKVTNGDLVSAIDDYESLPKSLVSIKNNPKTAWALAEAYRKLGQTGESVNLYSIAAKKSAEAPDKFKAQFWLAVMSAEKARSLEAKNGSNRQIQSLKKASQNADAEMFSAWNSMTPEEQDIYSTAYKTHFEKTVTQTTSLKTPAKIVLMNWTKALSTKVSTDNGGELTDWDKHFSPSGSSVYLLRDLAKRFSQMGLTQERRDTLKLLKLLSPKQFADDQSAKKIWASELISLAEDYRTASQNLDAGRIYAMVGSQSEDWEGRAEALYKGGLLLFKAGRREEALNALNEASNDGNNLFYSNLAKERLSQIK